MIINLGAFEPDIADIGMDTLAVALNTIPSLNSWRPFMALQAISEGALPDICRGICFVQTTAGVYDTYVATPGALYKFNADTLNFDVKGSGYALPSDDFWWMEQFGHYLICGNLGTAPQIIDIDGAAAVFGDLGGSPPKSRFAKVSDNKLVLACLESNPREIAWSDIDNPEEWVLGLAGGQDFPDHGAVMAFLPHARIVILERGVRSITPTSDTLQYEFPELTHEKGTSAPWSVIEFGREAYWLATEGFVTGSAEGFINLSEGRYSRKFFDEVNSERLFQVYGAYDPFSARLLWASPTGDTDYNDKLTIYDRLLTSPAGPGRWAEAMVDTYVISRLATAGVSLEGGDDPDDIDAPGQPSFDSRVYMAGAPILVAVGSDLKLSTFSGMPLEATFETATQRYGGPKRSRLKSVELLMDGTDVDQVTLKVRKKSRFSDDWTTSSAIPQQASGRYRTNSDGRLHRLEITVPAGIGWTHMQAYEPDFVPTSAR